MKDDDLRREFYFKQQDFTTSKYVVPYIERFKKINNKTRVLEVGCGEAGNLKSFVEKSCDVVGVDLNERKIKTGNILINKYTNVKENFKLIVSDIYDMTADEIGLFDIIILRDAIEHIPNQEKFMSFLHNFIRSDGVIFFAFPPWQMPFGGHQQGCKSILKKVPYFHLLPTILYKAILMLFKEPENHIETLLHNKKTGISIERFRKAVKNSSWKVLDETLYLINPNYEVKFNLTPKKQYKILGAIPFFRNFVTTCAYYIITPNK